MSASRCNAKCYDAKGKDCHCECNGINHGVGAQQARENMRKLGLIWRMPSRAFTVRKARKRFVPPEQGSLFDSLTEREADGICNSLSWCSVSTISKM
jgi:hypothetical protein